MTITNFSMMANLYRNHCRQTVDNLFKRKDDTLARINKNNTPNRNIELGNEAAKFDIEARILWREIVKTAESL